jgi:hypothetical protein
VCCGSGSAWIRIGLALSDPDLYLQCGSGSRSKVIDQNLQRNRIFSLSKGVFIYIGIFHDLLPKLSIPGIFPSKNSTFIDG